MMITLCRLKIAGLSLGCRDGFVLVLLTWYMYMGLTCVLEFEVASSGALGFLNGSGRSWVSEGMMGHQRTYALAYYFWLPLFLTHWTR